LAGFSAVFPAAVCFVHVRWLGFPDGYLSDLAVFEKKLFLPFSALILLCGCGFLYLGSSNNCRERKRKFVFLLRFFIVLLVAIGLVAGFGPLFFDVGIGG